MNIVYTNKFVKLFKRLPDGLRQKAVEKEAIFKLDPFSPSLRTHKLGGKHAQHWAFWIDHKNRIVFRFLPKNEAVFLLIGDHSVYQ